MRLLHTKELYFEEFFDSRIPPYAILSHVWGDEEISYQDFLDIRKLQDMKYAAYHELLRLDLTRSAQSAGYIKIITCCEIAASDNHEWVWIDTCCIDKRSSAELQETINSMYEWYRRSKVCYAYLVDVRDGSREEFMASRWFKRGWTLQELLASENVEFLDRSWNRFSSKYESHSDISVVTGIPEAQLRKKFEPWKSSVAEKMSWAAHRETTRVEDTAYCLLGLFSINMPLLYGEGLNAFMRLQEEIIRQDNDASIFAWRNAGYTGRLWLLADSPDCFAGCKAERQKKSEQLPGNPPILTNRGLQMDVHLFPLTDFDITVPSYPELPRESRWFKYFLAPLRCESSQGQKALVLFDISTSQLEETHWVFTCVDLGRMGIGREEILRRATRQTVYVMLRPSRWSQQVLRIRNMMRATG